MPPESYTAFGAADALMFSRERLYEPVCMLKVSACIFHACHMLLLENVFLIEIFDWHVIALSCALRLRKGVGTLTCLSVVFTQFLM